MRFGCIAILVFFLAACGSKKDAGKKDQAMDVSQLFNLFATVKLPYNISDTTLLKSAKEAAVISTDDLSNFVDDTVSNKYFNDDRTKLFALGKVPVKRGETYLFLKSVTGSRRAAYLLVYDKDKKFRAILPLIVADNDRRIIQQASMDNKYTISINRQRKKPNGDIGYKKEAYVFNNVGIFTLILTESNDDISISHDVVNPLDTLPKKNKLSGDYVIDKRNFISVRDGRRPAILRFFVHFEKDKGSCRGEIRGEATLTRPDVAIYRRSGDPCALEFTFGTNNVTMKEVEGCGNYRDIKCFFEGTYPRKKETRSKNIRKKK